MFYGHLGSKEDISLYPKGIQKALQYLMEHDLEAMAPGKYPIEGDDLILNVSELTTKSRSEKRPEIHVDYVDVQYVIRGCERSYFYTDMGDNEMDEDALATRDVAFYKPNPNANESYVTMQAGDYAVYFPWDVHTPACSVEEDLPEKKVILKVKMTAL
ncbi:MAG: YhcH/YjgK/YiaL family protein [Eubacteriales bacterium]|jgi:biofilm protein TabA